MLDLREIPERMVRVSKSPLVTVIIPTYNWSAVLPYAINSVLRQTMADFELLVIGDGCTDDSETVVGSIRDPRLRWINLPSNTGHQAGPNNRGLAEARGSSSRIWGMMISGLIITSNA